VSPLAQEKLRADISLSVHEAVKQAIAETYADHPIMIEFNKLAADLDNSEKYVFAGVKNAITEATVNVITSDVATPIIKERTALLHNLVDHKTHVIRREDTRRGLVSLSPEGEQNAGRYLQIAFSKQNNDISRVVQYASSQSGTDISIDGSDGSAVDFAADMANSIAEQSGDIEMKTVSSEVLFDSANRSLNENSAPSDAVSDFIAKSEEPKYQKLKSNIATARRKSLPPSVRRPTSLASIRSVKSAHF
jgi:hypothetical protein